MRALLAVLVLAACAHAPARLRPCGPSDPADAKDCRRAVTFGLPAASADATPGK